MQSAEETATGGLSTWKHIYRYDRFGNRNPDAGTTYPNYSQTPQDQETQLPIDAVGNPVVDGSSYRIKTSAAGQASYQYDFGIDSLLWR